MVNNVTNIRSFDFFDGKSPVTEIWIKQKDSKEILRVPYHRVFFTNAGSFKTKVGAFTVEPSDKQYYFTKQPVDRITITNPAAFKVFDSYPVRQLYNYDLTPEYQYLLYSGVEWSTEYDIMELDIETDDSIDSETAPEEVLMVGIKFRGKITTFDLDGYEGNERAMLEAAFKFITNECFPDVIIGWNVRDFDKKYLTTRAKNIGAKYDYYRWTMIEFVNLWDVLEKKFGWGLMKETGGRSLKKVAQHFLGRTKVEIDMPFGKLYRHDRHKAIYYNETDNQLTEDLNERLRCIHFLIAIQSVSGVPLRDCFWESYVIDFMILHRYSNYVFPSKDTSDVAKSVQYEGGYVLNAPTGIFENVAIFDFASMYPSIILTFNISPDSKMKYGTGDYKIDDVSFKKHPYGIFKETTKFLYDQRLRLKGELKQIKDEESIDYKNKDALQSAFKTILNSFYGVCAFQKFRFYDVDLAKTITSMGRKLIKVLKAGVEQYKLGEGLYGDTDSMFVQYKTDTNKILGAINNIIIPEYIAIYGIQENYVKVEIGKDFEWIIFFGKKKNYIAKPRGQEKLYIRGFFTERYDTPDPIRKMAYEMMKTLSRKENLDLTPYYEKIRALSLQDIAIVKRLNKDPEDYTSDPQHLVALEHSKVHMPDLDPNIYDSNIVRMLYVKSEKHVAMELAIDDDVQKLPDDFIIDYDRYIVFFLFKKMGELFLIFGWDKIIGHKDYLLSIVKDNERAMKAINKHESLSNDWYDELIKKSWSVVSKKKKPEVKDVKEVAEVEPQNS